MMSVAYDGNGDADNGVDDGAVDGGHRQRWASEMGTVGVA